MHPSMSPKGVEHSTAITPSLFLMTCIHQCRRKALSTRHTALRSAPSLRASINVAEKLTAKGLPLRRDLVAWIIPKDILSLVFSTLGVV